MKIEKLILKTEEEFDQVKKIKIKPDVIFLFGARNLLIKERLSEILHKQFTSAKLFGCSSAGEISGIEVINRSVVLTAIELESSRVKLESIQIDNQIDDHQLGMNLLNKFDKNGKAAKNCISALGFYGENISVGYGSNGGWDSFGLERLVTKSKANILYELDGKPALQLYKQFLGERAEGLPASGLLFPLSLRENAEQEPVVRTILGVNEQDQSMIFAGNIPEGAYVKLMKANVDRLINGAENSAITTTELLPKDKAEIAILISCVGRKLVLKQLIEEEVEAVSDVIGNDVCITGFYSYGEISPFRKNTPCMLHNQTMTITTISEK